MTYHWCSSGRIEPLRYWRNVCRRPEDVLLESSWRIIATDLLVEAHTLHAFETRWASSAYSRDPFYAYAVSNFHSTGLGSRAKLYDAPNSFMTTNLTWLCGIGKDGPGLHHDAVVGVADAGVCPEWKVALDGRICACRCMS